ncbi:MAG TPA: efflux RND transporter periplasmic adaptor subunit [Vicinamibacterales bacterium]|nr:efflux RND transporter periplasmic adaptor subunit [Vicinamibacterales bacterium]
MKRAVILAVGAVVLSGGAFAGYHYLGKSAGLSAAPAAVVPTARVTRGSMALTVILRGELRASKQTNLTAPPTGGALRILSMAETGTTVAKDDPVMEFDPADQQFELEKAESELQEAEQELIKRRAEIKAQEAGDRLTLLTAEFDVRRAGLDAAVDADLISANDHKIRQAELAEAERNLDKLKRDMAGRAITSKAALTVLEEKKNRSAMAAARARQNMDNLVLKAPTAGVVSVRENMDGLMYFYDGMSMPYLRTGDTVSSGRPVVDIYDLSSMEVRSSVNEQERANVVVGQTARIEADSVPGLSPTAKVTAVAGLGRADSRFGPLRQFDITLELTNPDPRLRPGTTVRVLVDGGVVENVLLVPRQALFEIDGKPNLYVRAGGADAFSPRQVKVLHRTESQIAVEGADEGTEVALVDPIAALKLSGTGTTGSSPMGVKK